tara:strand:+ start:763 stop:1803 length:1041 start_codon:yes stop_codon:yes gene_type:complete
MNRKISYREAINEALTQEMERDSSVFIYGIDVGDHKRIFGTTKGLVEQFGTDRCFSTPLSEDAMTGVGLGAAINGLRPIHVHMRADFLLLAMNQLCNMVSSYCYGSGGAKGVPMVIRTIIGRGWGQAYQHSKNANILAHFPGLKVVMPASPFEAKGMLVSAIRDDNPVIVFEHRWLYDAVDEVPDDEYMVPLDEQRKLRNGSDLTVVATSWMVVEAMKAANILRKHNVHLEIINACVASPCKNDVIVESVNKTQKCIVADNDWSFCGFGAELAAMISESCFKTLQLPVRRLGFAHVPCPCTRPLENEFYCNAVNIIKLVEEMLGLPLTDLSGEDFYSYERKFKGPF